MFIRLKLAALCALAFFVQGCAHLRPQAGEWERFSQGLARIPAGEFEMGSPEGQGEPDEHPRRKVFLDAYSIDRFPVTVLQYRQFARETGRAMHERPAWNGDDHPVVYVSWHDAQAYCLWAGRRLPTEAEWEKAARGGTGTRYSFGDDEKDLGGYAWYIDNSSGTTHPVGAKKPNPYGLYDMNGNVYEWVSDWYSEDYYGKSPPS
jgi:formylglycine-generating enzyme required for sulfatase activity